MRRLNTQNGFTLLEVVLVAAILAFCITAMLRLYVFTSTQAELSGNKTQAISAAQNVVEEIRGTGFSAIATDFASGGTPGDTFTLSKAAGDQIDGMGKVYLDNNGTYITGTNSELLGVIVVVSWQNKFGRVVGEDQDLDGVLDSGEDVNGNGRLDSPAMIMTMVTRK